MIALIILAAIVAGLWTAGCVLLPLWAAYTLWDESDTGVAAAVLCIGWPIALLMAALPWAFILEQQSPDLAVLKKNEWFCTQQHTVVTTTMVMSGKVMVPVTSSHQVCDQYNKK